MNICQYLHFVKLCPIKKNWISTVGAMSTISYGKIPQIWCWNHPENPHPNTPFMVPRIFPIFSCWNDLQSPLFNMFHAEMPGFFMVNWVFNDHFPIFFIVRCQVVPWLNDVQSPFFTVKISGQKLSTTPSWVWVKTLYPSWTSHFNEYVLVFIAMFIYPILMVVGINPWPAVVQFQVTRSPSRIHIPSSSSVTQTFLGNGELWGADRQLTQCNPWRCEISIDDMITTWKKQQESDLSLRLTHQTLNEIWF